MIIDPNATSESIAVASGLILGALLDALIAKNLMTSAEVKEVMISAMKGIGARPSSEIAEVAEIITTFSRHYGERSLLHRNY